MSRASLTFNDAAAQGAHWLANEQVDVLRGGGAGLERQHPRVGLDAGQPHRVRVHGGVHPVLVHDRLRPLGGPDAVTEQRMDWSTRVWSTVTWSSA